MPPDTPTSYGYYMPAEWEPHAATWLAWPHNTGTWPEQLEQVQAIYLQLIDALHRQETVHLLVNETSTAIYVLQQLARRGTCDGKLVLHHCPTVDAWLRDSGPIFLVPTSRAAQSLAIVDWRFTAWGGKYPEMLADDNVPQVVAHLLGLPRFQPGLALEGGAIDVNGRGSCLTTEQCLLHPNRNPHMQRADIEHALHDYLGIRQVIWLGQGIAGDDTDGHVDDIARFVNATTVVCALTDDPQHADYAPLQDNYQRLQAATDQNGQPLRLVPLPMPGFVGSVDGPLPASYANFYIANGLVLVPIYDHPNDHVALTILQDLFPDRRVIGIPCTSLVGGLGAIHCITQQQPILPSR